MLGLPFLRSQPTHRHSLRCQRLLHSHFQWLRPGGAPDPGFRPWVSSLGACVSCSPLAPLSHWLRVHRYCFAANIFTVLYAVYQIFKNICDIAHRGVFISDMASDYISFVLDQVNTVSVRTIFHLLIQVHHRASIISCLHKSFSYLSGTICFGL